MNFGFIAQGFLKPLIHWSSTGDFLARPVDFCWSWASRPTEFLCLTQKGNNLDQQKNLDLLLSCSKNEKGHHILQIS